MKRVASLAVAGILALSVAEGARAQTTFNEPDVTGTVRAGSSYDQPAARGQYGGGFIELLVTGRDPTYAQPVRPDPLGRRLETYGGNAVRTGRDGVIPAEPIGRPPRGPTTRMVSIPDQPAVDVRPIGRVLPPEYRKQIVDYSGGQPPGTIIIDTPNRFLFLVQSGGKALRYGIGVGRPGFEWAGVKSVTRKAAWPDWRPPSEMLKRRPDLPRFVAGGPDNPLGARALYLGSSLYRIHGTNEPHTIGQAVSSGCIRMTNDDVTDLYERVGVGARVVVM